MRGEREGNERGKRREREGKEKEKGMRREREGEEC